VDAMGVRSDNGGDNHASQDPEQGCKETRAGRVRPLGSESFTKRA
jgi:hypothetical protein